MFFRLVNIERQGRKILLIARSEDKNRHIFTVINFFPFFYIREGINVPQEFRSRVIKRERGNWKTLDGIPVSKVTTKYPDDVREIRDSLPLEATFEADVIYTTRFLIEAKIRSGYFKVRHFDASSPKVDIKFEDIVPIDNENIFIPVREGQLDEEAVKGQSVLISVWDSYTNKIYSVGWKKHGKSKFYEDTFIGLTKKGNKVFYGLPIPRSVQVASSKQEMFKLWIKLMKKLEFDVLGGWYIKGYDIPQIFNQAASVGYGLSSISPFNSAPAPEKIKGLVQFDMLSGVKRMESTNIRSYKLPNVMKSFFNVEIPSNPKMIPDMWKKYYPLVDYNSSHTDACRFLSQENGVIEFIYQLVYLCCVRFDDVESSLRLIDALMLSIKDENIVYPNRPKWVEGREEEEVRGALVVEPIPGIVYKYELIFDYKRLYPSAMISINAGIETLDPNGDVIVRIKNTTEKVVQVVRFSSKKRSELRRVFDYLFVFRDRIQEKIKMAVKGNHSEKIKEHLKKQDMVAKVATNIVYGLTGNASFRLFKKVVQACTTQVARDAEEWMWNISTNYATELGIKNRINAGDTDSCHLWIKVKKLKTAIKVGEQIAKHINESFEDFVKQYNIKKHSFNVKLEAITSRAFYKAKKRYILKIVYEDDHILDKPHYKIVGLEPRSSAVPELTGKVISKVLHDIVDDISVENISKYINKKSNKIKNGYYEPFKIGIPKGLNNPIRDYFKGKCRINKKTGQGCGFEVPGILPFSESKEYENKIENCPNCGKRLTWTKPIHSLAADYSNANLGTKFGQMDKPRYLYVLNNRYKEGRRFVNKYETGKYPETHVIAIHEDFEIPKDIKIDLNIHANKVVNEKAIPLLEIIQKHNCYSQKRLI